MVEELLYYAKVFKGIGCCWWVTAWIIHGSSIKIKEDSVRLIAYRKGVMQRPKSSFMKFYLKTWLSLRKNSFQREWTSLDSRGIKKKKLGQGRINVVTCSRKLIHCFLFPSAIPRNNNSKEKDSMVYGGFICVLRLPWFRDETRWKIGGPECIIFILGDYFITIPWEF